MVLIAGYNSPQSMILIGIMIESSVSATNRRYKLANSLFLPDTHFIPHPLYLLILRAFSYHTSQIQKPENRIK